MASLWVRMADMFGHRWISGYGVKPSDTWTAGLMDFTEKEILGGIVHCMDWQNEWPPTLGQFRELCKLRRGETRRFFVAGLPEPPEVKEKRATAAREGINHIRDGMKYSEWMQKHENRQFSDIELIFQQIRAGIQLNKIMRKI